MYPFDELRPAWEQLWGAVHERAPWTPTGLRWDGDAHDHWVDQHCHVAQACGWPVVTTLRHDVEVVGAFALMLDDAEGHRYRSVVLANRPGSLSDLDPATTTVAANAADSLSGWVSLLAVTVGPGSSWSGPVTWTGGHVESIRALRAGDAGVVSVDALSLAYIRRDRPDLVVGLHEVGHGPLVPSLPVVVRKGTATELVDELRVAIAETLADPALADVRTALLIDGFVALDESDYMPLIQFAPAS